MIPDRVNENEYDEIDRWMKGAQPRQSGQLPGVDDLPDGPGDFEILSAELGRTSGEAKEMIFRLRMRPITGPLLGLTFERPFFFRRQESLEFLAGELMTLGFAADQWLQSQSFGRELAAACPKFKGLRFQGKKVSKQGDDNKTYHQLYINALLHGAPMPPSAPSSRVVPPRTPPPAVNHDASEIPF